MTKSDGPHRAVTKKSDAQRASAAPRWSSPTLKARWFDDEGIATVEPAAEATRNTLKAAGLDAPIEALSVQAFFDRLAVPPDEPASG